jgi:hypothetical protein
VTDKIQLTSIDLTTKEGQEVKLGIDEARALYLRLRELFGEKERVRIEPAPYPVPYPMPIYRPVIIPDRWTRWSPRWEVTGQSGWLSTSDSSGLQARYSGVLSS